MVAIFALDGNQRCRFLNAVAEVLTGMTTVQATGIPFRDVIWRRHPVAFDESLLGRALVNDEGGVGEESILGGDGVFRLASFRVVPLDLGARTTIVEIVDLSGETGTGRALRESEQRFRLAVEATGIGIWDVDAISGERRWSPEFTALLGLPPHTRPNMDVFTACIHPDDRDWVNDRYRQAFSDPAANPYQAEFRIFRASDGSERWLSVTGRVWFDPDGKALRGIGTLRDITERRRIDETIREREERLRVALVAGRMGTWRYTVATGEQQWDDTQYALLGIDRSEPASRRLFLALVHPDDTRRVMFDPADPQQRGAFVDKEFRIVRPDGHIRWIASHTLTRYGPNGRATEMIGVNRDITSEKEAEVALRLSEQRHRLAVEAAGIGTWDIDMLTGERRWSAQFSKIWGLPPDAPSDTELLQPLISPEAWDRARAILQDAANPAGTGNILIEYEIRRADDGERRWCVLTGQMYFDEAGTKPTRAMGIMIDVTARKALEQRQRLALREMNHRVKNSLAVVQAIVSQTIRLTPDPQEAFERIQSRVMALSRTHDFLDQSSWDGSILSRLAASEMEPFAGSSRVELIGPQVRLDSAATLALGIVFHELSSNAVLHGALSAPGGRVEVNWRVAGGSPLPSVDLQWIERGGPGVAGSRRRGLGWRLIESSVRASLRGTIKTEYAPEGLRCRIVFPLNPIAEQTASDVLPGGSG